MNSSLIVLTGKTASGKDTIKLKLLSKYPNLKKVLTTTSRNIRPNETDNIDYHFLTRTEFEARIKNNEFVEYVEYGGNLYGTYKKELEQALQTATLWKIDPSRAGEVRDFIKRSFSKEVAEQLLKRVVVIYINTQDDIILQRLKNRGLNEEEIQKRMDDDKAIWQKYQNFYDFVIENVPGQLNQTLDKVFSIIENHQKTAK